MLEVPAIFFKYKGTKEINETLEKGMNISLDVLTIVLSGETALFAEVSLAQRIWAAIEVAGAIGQVGIDNTSIDNEKWAKAIEHFNGAINLIGLKNFGKGMVFSAETFSNAIKENSNLKSVILAKYTSWQIEVKNLGKLDDAEQQLVTKQEKVWKMLGAAEDVAKTGNEVIRGISKVDFKLTFTASDEIAERAWGLWKSEKWAELEDLFNNNGVNVFSGISFPPNNGAINIVKKTLDPADYDNNLIIDRYGSTGGKFTSPANTPFEKRALPSSYVNQTPKKYKVIKPIENVEEGEIIPWFKKPGKGIQYKFEKSVQYYIDEGFIVEIK